MYEIIPSHYLNHSSLPPAKRSLGQGNIVTGVCENLCMGEGVFVKGGLCPGGSLSRDVSVQRVSVQAVSAWGISVQGGLCQGDPRTVKSGQYAFYWNAFLLISCLQGQNFKS